MGESLNIIAFVHEIIIITKKKIIIISKLRRKKTKFEKSNHNNCMFSLECNITPDDKKRKRNTIIALDFLAKCLLKLKPALRATMN